MLSRETPNTVAPGLHEILVLVAELHRFGGATRRVVLGIEVQNHGVAKWVVLETLTPPGGIGFKFGEGFVDNDRHKFLESRVQVVSGSG
jgi:hypothetical protein